MPEARVDWCESVLRPAAVLVVAIQFQLSPPPALGLAPAGSVPAIQVTTGLFAMNVLEATEMAQPLIAVVGSVDQNRHDYEPPLRNVQHVVHAAEQLGDELAAAGWKPDYIEVRRRADLKVPRAGDHEVVVLGAARLGRTRLIDSLEF